MAADDVRVGFQERPADILGEGKIGVPVSGVEGIVENTADAAGFVPMGQKKIFVAPFFEFWIVGFVMAVAGVFIGAVEIGRILFDGKNRCQVATAAEPALGGHDHAGVHVCRRPQMGARLSRH